MSRKIHEQRLPPDNAFYRRRIFSEGENPPHPPIHLHLPLDPQRFNAFVLPTPTKRKTRLTSPADVSGII
jgi:hypothetical protein